MPLRIDDLKRELQMVLPYTEFRAESRDLPLGRPLLLAPGEPIEKNRVYLAFADSLPDACDFSGTGSLLLLAGSALPDAARFPNACLYPVGTDLFRLHNAVQGVFDRYERRAEAGEAAMETEPVISRMRQVEKLLKILIADEKAEREPVSRELAAFAWQQQHAYCCIAARIGSLDYRSYTLRTMCALLEALLPHACAFEQGDGIAIVVNLTLFSGDIEDAIRVVNCFLRDHFLKAGVSEAFCGTHDLFYYHRQASVALEMVMSQQSYHWLLRFPDVALDYVIEQGMRDMPLHVICARGVQDMKRYDDEHDTEFLKTLACYIRNRFNALQTAKELFIHRSTFLYRLDRIKELFRIDLENDGALLYTMISVKMLDISRTRKTTID